MIFTCVSCHVIFANSDLHRQHYRSDWHRYNLKRKIAELPPITADEFEQRVASQKEIQEGEVKQLYCSLCRKSFSSENALSSHLKSKKHLELQKKHPEHQRDTKSINIKNLEKNLNRNVSEKDKAVDTTVTAEKASNADMEISDDDDSDWESCDEDEPADIEINECLFCLHKSETLDNNVEHMVTAHSFFIPDVEYLTDLSGLISYLGEKIGTGHVCLWCCDKGKSFHSTKSVQQHMMDKGHCKMYHDGDHLFEYSDFYDYSSSYPEDKVKADDNDEVEIPQLETDNWELVLPSGATAGHRSLARYFKQNLPPERSVRSSTLQRLMAKYRALGWTGLTGEQAMQKARDIKFMRKVQSKQALKLAVKNNKFQPHFRSQVMF